MKIVQFEGRTLTMLSVVRRPQPAVTAGADNRTASHIITMAPTDKCPCAKNYKNFTFKRLRKYITNLLIIFNVFNSLFYYRLKSAIRFELKNDKHGRTFWTTVKDEVT